MDNGRRLQPFLYNCFLCTMFRLKLKISYVENTLYENIQYTKIAEMEDNYPPAYHHHHQNVMSRIKNESIATKI